MTESDITDPLETIASSDDFPARSAELVEGWLERGAGVEVVPPVLRFMERHPSIDYGTPGALVHFVERFRGKGYEEGLLDSVRRRPTAATVWMLNRLINGTTAPDARRRLVASMQEAARNPLADEQGRARAASFLERLTR